MLDIYFYEGYVVTIWLFFPHHVASRDKVMLLLLFFFNTQALTQAICSCYSFFGECALCLWILEFKEKCDTFDLDLLTAQT